MIPRSITHSLFTALTGRTEMPLPEKSITEVIHRRGVPTLRWRHYELTAEQARFWAVELLKVADEAERAWQYEEAARESKDAS